MRMRSAEEVVDFLSQSSQRRKRELITVQGIIDGGRQNEAAVASRAAVVLAYAHWEGFVKDAAQAYVSYVDFAGLPLKRLIVNFQALACKTAVTTATHSTRRIGLHVDLAGMFFDQAGQVVPIEPSKAIDTESNLNWEVFTNICLSIGLDTQGTWSSYSHFIDDLFKTRCEIAHGSVVPTAPDYAVEAISRVCDFLEWFKSDVENAVVGEHYLRS